MKHIPFEIIVCFTVLVLASSAADVSLTETEKNSIKRMHEQFCGTDRMCSRSSNTEAGECAICPGCRCDDHCDKYGDCCADIAIDHLNSPNFHPSRYQCSSNAFKLIYDRKQEFSFHSIQKCSLRSDEDLVQLCEHPDHQNITLSIPAQTEQDVYRNQFCAECNGETDYVLWDIKAECTQLVWLNKGMSSLQILQSFIDDIGCAIFLRPKKGYNHRPCYTPEEEMISTCDVSKLKNVSESMEKFCHSYSAPIHLFEKVYRNVFCYMCNYGSLDDTFIAPPSCAFDTAYPFSVVLDPEAIHITQKKIALSCECDPGYIYDRHTEECKHIECTADRILRDEICFSVIRSANGLVYLLEVLLKPTSSLLVNGNINSLISGTANKLKNQLKQLIGGGFVGVGLFRVGVHARWSTSGAVQEIMSISIHTKFIIKWESEIDQMESTLLELRQSHWTIQIDNEDVRFMSEPFWTDPDDKTMYPRITEEVIDEEDSIYRLDHGFTVDLTKNHDALYVSETLKCPRVKVFQDVDYSYSEETSTWEYAGSNETLDISQFEPASNKSGFVCFVTFRDNVTNCGRSESLSPAPLRQSPLIYVSLVCHIIALVCLFLTFLVFCIFKSLRTLPGKNTMGLVFTLFVAIFLYTVGSSKVELQHTCNAIGISIHFFLLSSFTWMSICTVHMYTVIRTILLAQHSDFSHWKRFTLYLAVSVIVPGIIVGSTVAGNHFLSDGQNTGYGMDICFVSNFYSVLLAVGAPIAIVMIVNGCVFAATVISLKKASKQQQELQTQKRNISIYVNLSTLTGINWFFGIVSILVDADVFKYIFVILCAIQGVYIFVSFACTRKVLYQLRDCCRNRSGTKSADEIKIKMTFNGKDLEIEELGQDKDPDYACIKDMKEARLSLEDFDEIEDEVTGADAGSVSDNYSVKSDSGSTDKACDDSDDERIHEVDMHNAGCDEGDYGLLMHATTKEIRDPCNVLFNPVFK